MFSNFFLKFVATYQDLIILEMINITALIDCSFYLFLLNRQTMASTKEYLKNFEILLFRIIVDTAAV